MRYKLGNLDTKMATYRLDKLSFSGKEEDFLHFQEQFESRMYMLKLHDALLDKIEINGGTADDVYQRNVSVREARFKVWCELTQCLDRQTLMLIRRDKPNGMQAWKTLVAHYCSTQRPRIQKTLTQLTDLKMRGDETLTDYFCRAEELQIDLEEAEEPISETMFSAIVLKGLPKEFETAVTLLNHGEQKTFAEMKTTLTNFANTKLTPTQQVFCWEQLSSPCAVKEQNSHNC